LDENIIIALFMDENNFHHTSISEIYLMTIMMKDRYEMKGAQYSKVIDMFFN
jgi:hypothetical protein